MLQFVVANGLSHAGTYWKWYLWLLKTIYKANWRYLVNIWAERISQNVVVIYWFHWFQLRKIGKYDPFCSNSSYTQVIQTSQLLRYFLQWYLCSLKTILDYQLVIWAERIIQNVGVISWISSSRDFNWKGENDPFCSNSW